MGEFLVAILCLAGCVFAVSAGAKLRGPRAYRLFRSGLRETMLAPRRLLPALAAALAAAEAVTAAGLLAAAGAVAAAVPGAIALAELVLAAAWLLTATLAVGVAAVVHRGTRAHCACFGGRAGHAGRPLGRPHLIRNLTLLAVLACGLAACPMASRPAAAGAGLAAAAGAVAGMVFIRWEDLADLFAPAGQESR